MKSLFRFLLLSSVAALFASCNSSTFGPEPSSSALDGKCTIDMLKYKTQEQLDSLRTFCDTIFVHSVLNVYKDSVYDDTLITGNEKYTSFIYFDRYTEKYDTLTKQSAAKSGTSGPCGRVPVYCNLDSSDTQKTFSCEISSVCYMYNQTDNLAMSSAEVAVVRLDPVLITNEPLCSQPGYRCVRDTVFHDVLHKTYRTIARDTTFLNYGPRAWTDYVPAINAPAFDTAAFHNALDTLDTQKPIFGIDTLFSAYTVTVEGLPDWASNRSKCTTNDSLRVCVVLTNEDLYTLKLDVATIYPSSYTLKPFHLWNSLEAPLEKDTLITWKLKYRYYEGHYFKGNSDSLEITTLFKGI